jgi:hypothetical protein
MAIFINRKVPENPNVQYNGKTYPADREPIAAVPVDPNVQYNGATYPRDKVDYTPPVTDPTNNPSIIVIGGFQLPPDTLIMLNGEKIITSDPILDGVVVYEHISRRPYEIDFDIVIREQGAIQGYNNDGSQNESQSIPTPQPFPQQTINDVWTKIWQPDSVQQITNTYLNNLGILEIIIKGVKPATVRGSKNVPITIKAFENIPGQSIIISNVF